MSSRPKMIRAKLSEIDGLSVKDVKRLPHPIELADWKERGLYEIDGEYLRLTPAGRAAARAEGEAA